MNLRRGLFRLWAAVSIAWIGLLGWLAYENWPEVVSLWFPYLRAALAPPLVLLILGAVGIWIVGGFKRQGPVGG